MPTQAICKDNLTHENDTECSLQPKQNFVSFPLASVSSKTQTLKSLEFRTSLRKGLTVSSKNVNGKKNHFWKEHDQRLPQILEHWSVFWFIKTFSHPSIKSHKSISGHFVVDKFHQERTCYNSAQNTISCTHRISAQDLASHKCYVIFKHISRFMLKNRESDRMLQL